MKTLAVFGLLAVSCFGRVQSPTNSGFLVEHPQVNDRQMSEAWIEYHSHEVLYADKVAEFENRMIEGAEKDSALAKIPAGGYILCHIYRVTIGSANTKWFEYVVKMGGREVVRRMGDPQVPSVPGLNSDLWSNLDIIELPEPIDSTATFYLIDGLGGRDTFTITKP